MTSEVEQLIANSKANEAIAKKLFDIETEVLACSSSEELLKKLLTSIRDKFNLSHILLLLAEPMPINYLLSGQWQSSWHQQHTKKVNLEHLAQFHKNHIPYLTQNLTTLTHIAPTSILSRSQSAALIPLKLEGKLFASLLFTDDDKSRFDPKLGTFLLEQLAVKISLCLSNVLIREQLEHMAHYDRLTGVANRRLMEESITEELIRFKRYQVPFSLLFIDCNKFKQINDTYGHDCGDKVLAYVANQLCELIRENDKCFRYAGDEFVVVLANQSYQEALLAGKRLCQFFIDHPMPYQEQERKIKLPITISCGAAASEEHATMDSMLKKADQQLYTHKKLTARIDEIELQ